MDTPITRAEHDEFVKRMEEEDSRQNKRLELLEKNIQEMGALTTSVAKLATSMENMTKEQEKQGKQLEALEGRDGAMWRTVTSYAVTAVIGLLIGYVFSRIGM